MRLLFICALLVGSLSASEPHHWFIATPAHTIDFDWDGTAYATPDCGLDAIFTTAYCGNVGDPWAGGGQPASTVSVSAAAQTYSSVTANAVYRFTSALTAADSTCAAGWQFTGGVGPLIIDLNGFSHTGVICITARYLAGIRVVNGTLTCTVIGSGTITGCIRYLATPGGAYTGQVRFSYLTVSNTADPGGGSANMIYSEIGPASSVITPVIRFDHITSSSGTAATAVRLAILQSNGGSSTTGNPYGVKFDHNHLTIAADTSAGQGMVALYQVAPEFSNNYVNLIQNTTAQSARGILLDTDNNTTNYCTACANGIVRNNLIIANNNRAVRNRGSATMLMENNTIKEARNASGVIQVGDATSPQGDYLNQGLVIQNNTIEIQDGGGIWGRGITGVLIRNNTFTCSSSGCTTGRVVTAATPAGVQATTTFDLQNNATAAIGGGASCTGGTATKSCALTTTTINACNSGTFSGAGTVNATTCP